MNEILKLTTCSIWGHEADFGLIEVVAKHNEAGDDVNELILRCVRCERGRMINKFATVRR